MTAPISWPELMPPLPAAPAYGEPAATSVQQPSLTDLFASLLETCLDASLLRDEPRQPAASVASPVPAEAEEEPILHTPTREPSAWQASIETAPAEQEEAEAPTVAWGGAFAPMPPPQVEIALHEVPDNGTALPPPVAPLTTIFGEPVRTLPQAAVLTAPGNGPQTEPPRAARPIGDLAFAARLSDRSSEQGQRQLLAVLAAPESEARLAETSFGARTNVVQPGPDHLLPGVPTPAAGAANRSPSERPLGSERCHGPQAQVPVRDGHDPRQPEADPTAKPDATEETAHEGEAASIVLPVKARPAATGKRQSLFESPDARPAFLRPALPLAPPVVFAEHRATPMAPYRAPEFVATQPGVRAPWSTSADLPTNSTDPRPRPVHEVSLAVPSRVGETREHAQVQVRVVERAGEIKVAVHTPDTELAQSMREQLGDLVQRLERTGYHTETWQPGEAYQPGLRQSDLGSEKDTTSGRQGDQQGSPHHQSRQHRQQEQDRPRWFETLEAAGLGDVSFRPDRRSTHDLSH